MDSFILVGGGYHHLRRDQLKLLDGALVRTDGSGMFLTSAVQADFFRRGVSVGKPGLENLLNDLVALYVAQGVASDTVAEKCYAELEAAGYGTAGSTNVAEIAFQRVAEAALGFNLLAIGSTWRPKVADRLPYWSRDWVAWCDKHLSEFEHVDESMLDFPTSIALGLALDSLRIIRGAFATSAKPYAPTGKNRALDALGGVVGFVLLMALLYFLYGVLPEWFG